MKSPAEGIACLFILAHAGRPALVAGADLAQAGVARTGRGDRVLTLRAAVLGAGVYLLDGYRVSLCAWRTGASQPEQPFSPPVACPLPVGTAVSVRDAKP